ncbi:MAG TPA: hypothetical protein VFE14_05945 [Micromonosporaceae bacterium]|nr:hypothetical protein [Micromonosporaceae bacterium]
MTDREAARATAAEVGWPGIPTSMRLDADAPGAGPGTGHWHRQVDRLLAAVERSRAAVVQAPAGGVRDQLADLLHVIELRSARYERIAEVGQALWPDDDTTDADGTAPGERPDLGGAAQDIDARLVTALAHLTAVASAVEQIALAAAGTIAADRAALEVERLFRVSPPP